MLFINSSKNKIPTCNVNPDAVYCAENCSVNDNQYLKSYFLEIK